MSINIYKDQMQKARLFGASVLYSRQPIPREDIPVGWYCYDLCGTAEDPSGRPGGEKSLRLRPLPSSAEKRKGPEQAGQGQVRIDLRIGQPEEVLRG